MTANTAHAPQQLPPNPMQLRRPIKRTAAEASTMFEKPAAPAKKRASTPAALRADVASGPTFWEHVDGLLQSLPVKQAAEAIGQQLGLHTKTLQSVGRDALVSVASLAPRAVREWAKQSAPPPPAQRASTNAAKRAAVAELGTLLVDLHVEESRRAHDAFVACVVEVARLIDDSDTAREIACAAAHQQLVSLLGDELVDEAAAHVPSTRHVVDMHAKRARMSRGALADAMRLVGDGWQRVPNAGAGKLVLQSETFVLAIDVSFATFRVRDRQTGRAVNLAGSLVDEVEADGYFTATHFRIDA